MRVFVLVVRFVSILYKCWVKVHHLPGWLCLMKLSLSTHLISHHHSLTHMPTCYTFLIWGLLWLADLQHDWGLSFYTRDLIGCWHFAFLLLYFLFSCLSFRCCLASVCQCVCVSIYTLCLVACFPVASVGIFHLHLSVCVAQQPSTEEVRVYTVLSKPCL